MDKLCSSIYPLDPLTSHLLKNIILAIDTLSGIPPFFLLSWIILSQYSIIPNHGHYATKL